MTLEDILAEAAATGLDFRGGLAVQPDDGLPLTQGTLLLFGFAGGNGWQTFAAAPEYTDGGADPLDRWSRRIIDKLAASWGGHAFYPFGGPPYRPFQQWAQRAQAVFPSPLGLLIHPVFGLWHAYRGAVLLGESIELPAREEAAHPCLSCLDKPCLSACPVDAFGKSYDVPRCTSHLRTEAQTCLDSGCLARLACPVGAACRHGEEQMRFHMRAFYQSRG